MLVELPSVRLSIYVGRQISEQHTVLLCIDFSLKYFDCGEMASKQSMHENKYVVQLLSALRFLAHNVLMLCSLHQCNQRSMFFFALATPFRWKKIVISEFGSE